MVSITDYGKNPIETTTEVIAEDNDPNTFLSIMAGIGSGLFKIPEGLFSLGATLIDLGADTNKAAEVEEFFAKINPFDEMAEATTAGKITELITNLAIPGGIAFKLGNQLTKTALLAKKSHRYLDLGKTSAANINKGIKTKLGFNTTGKAATSDLTKLQKLKAFDQLAPGMDKVKAFAGGAGLGGVAEGIFVGDTEDAGTFGDLLGGPTEMERRVEGDEYDPGMDLRNRLKFGIEGAAFTGLFGAAGQAIKKLKNAKDADRVSDNKILDFVKRKLSPEGDKTKSAFLVTKEAEALVAGDATATNNIVQNISSLTAQMFPLRRRIFMDKTTEETQKKINDLYNQVLFSSDIKRGAKESAEAFKKRQQLYIKSGKHLELNPNIETKINTTIKNITETLPVSAGRKIIIDSKGNTGTVFGFNKKNIKMGNTTDNYIIKGEGTRKNWMLDKQTVDALNPDLPSKVTKKVVPVRDMDRNVSTVVESVGLGPMNETIQNNIIKQIKALNKSKKSGMKQLDDKKIEELVQESFDQIQGARMGMGQLLGIIGKRLDNKGVKEFKDLLRDKITGSLDRSYEITKNMNKIDKTLIAYKVPRQYMDEAKQLVSQVFKKNTGKEISQADLQSTINKIINKDNLKNFPEDGFNLGRSDVPEFNLPGFFVGKSASDDIFKFNNSRKLSEMTGIEQQAMKKLLTKNDDALQNIILGTQNLSTYARGVQMMDNMVRKDLLEKSKGNVGIFRNTKKEALTDFAPSSGKQLLGPEIKRVSAAQRTDIGLEKGPLQKLRGPRVDAKQTLRPISLSETMGEADTLIKNASDKEEFLRLAKYNETQPTVISMKKKTKGQRVEMPIIHPVGDKYALTGNVDGIFRSMENLAKNPKLSTKLYQNFILYPKATSQMAKTILSPFTHGRNFISAGAFAMANGMIPFADREAVKRAYNALQVPLWNARKNIKAGTNLKRLTGETDKAYKNRQKNYLEGNEFYQKLLRLGVVNSQVQLGDISALLRDVKFGGITGDVAQNLDGYGLNKMLKVLKNVKKFSEDAYTAEDDFWKIFSFIGESKRLKKYYDKAGIKGSQKFHTLSQSKKIKSLMDDGYSRMEAEARVPKTRITDDLIDEEAAAIIRNNIPNYAYVGDFIKGLRALPFGNFVSFPAEMLRTSVNIVERGLDEVFYQIKNSKGELINPLRTIGLQRLSGMAFTSAVVPAGVVAGFSALYDVTAEERTAMKNWVASWSKNSTLVPIRNSETGKLGYVDFSHSNAYDTISRPIQTILNRVAAGEQDQNGMIDDFVMGVLEGTKELGMPFITESIWTEALADLYFRKGVTQDGFKVWNKEDNLGNKIKKGIAHLGLSQAPMNWKQLKRIGLSMYPKDNINRFDNKGREYELGNEAAGIVGFRIIDIKPEEAMPYKVAQYTKSRSNAKNLFTAVALRGGVVTPKELVDAYINANRALFETQKKMNNDINSAKILDADQNKIVPYLIGRLGKKEYGTLQAGIFKPYIPSKKIFMESQKLATKLGIENPLTQAIGEMANIRAQLFQVNLDEDMFPTIENPFDTPIIPDLISSINSMIPNSITGDTANIPGSNFGTVPTNNLNLDQQIASGKKVFNKPGEIIYSG